MTISKNLLAENGGKSKRLLPDAAEDSAESRMVDPVLRTMSGEVHLKTSPHSSWLEV